MTQLDKWNDGNTCCNGAEKRSGGGEGIFEEELAPHLSPTWRLSRPRNWGWAVQAEVTVQGSSMLENLADWQSSGVRWGWGAGGEKAGEVGGAQWRVTLTISCVCSTIS